MGAAECKLERVGEENLYMCWCKERCLLGQGAYGNVYKGKWQEKPTIYEYWVGKRIYVAVKVQTGPYHIEYEIAALIKANGHRNILKFYEEIQVKSPPSRLIVTELCDGTLHDLIVVNKDSMKLSSDQLRDVLRQIVEGVKHLHENGIIHRDLKPHNILFSDKGYGQLVMKVADFGCSRSVTGDMTHYTRTVTVRGYSQRFRPFGTDGWLAPEVLNGVKELRPPHAVDIYPLGLIFPFTLCGGKHPYGEDATARDERMKKNEPMLECIRQQLNEEHGKECYYLIDRMLDPNPEERPTASQVLEDLKFFEPRPVTVVRDRKVGDGPSPPVWLRWVLGFFGITICVIFVAAEVFSKHLFSNIV